MKKKDSEKQEWATNRIKSRQPHKTKWWCSYCDRAFIFQGKKKCPNCGCINEMTQKDKKW